MMFVWTFEGVLQAIGLGIFLILVGLLGAIWLFETAVRSVFRNRK